MVKLTIFLFLFYSFSVQSQVTYWCGGITTTEAVIQVNINSLNLDLKCISEAGDTIETIQYQEVLDDVSGKFRISGLNQNTKYSYFLIEGIDTVGTGLFKTFPSAPADFSFVFGSCLRHTGTPVFTRMLDESPLLYICSGDIHYEDIKTESIDQRMDAFRIKVLEPPEGKQFFSHVPVAYMWDDHDYCGNNSGSDCAGRNSALEAYRAGVPHYPLPAHQQAGVYQAFSIGNIRFILSDLRSERTERFLMSAEQEEWFRQEVLAAAERLEMVCWVSSIPWIGTESDSWGGYELQRKRIAQFLQDNNITNFFMLAGDAHMIAADNGYNSDYSDARFKNGFPVLHAAAINQVGTLKGGPYTEGAFPNPDGTGQYGVINVEDLGNGKMCIEFLGKRVSSQGEVSTILNYEFCKLFEDPLIYNIQPNPAANSFELLISNAPIEAVSTLEIIDVSGRTHFTDEIIIREGSNTFSFTPGNSFVSGIYLVRFWYRGRWYSLKLSYH